MKTKTLILASTSIYRKALLEQLAVPFQILKPIFDEDIYKRAHPAPAARPEAFAESLAFLKAESLKGPCKVVLGGDQLVTHEEEILGKPHTREVAIQQLLRLQDKEHQLMTAICVFDGNEFTSHLDITRLQMKPLTRAQIERYVDLDSPLDCAGSYKIEKHGIMLFEKIESQDFSAIQGLPLIALSRILMKAGFSIP
jgi:septum formation protein